MYRFLSAFSGALTALMILMNGELTRWVGVFGASVVAHLTGLIGAALILALPRSAVPHLGRTDPIALAGGSFGAFAVVLSSYALVWLGVPLTLGLGLLGQTVASAVIDHLGVLGVPQNPFTWSRAGAMSLVMLGIAVMSWT